MCVGLWFYFQPIANELYVKYNAEKTIKTFVKVSDKYKDLKKEIEEYNQSIYENGQKDFRDAWSVQQSPIELKGFDDNVFGYIRIPKMDVKLPLYLGATNENMEKGAVILGQTSIPIGGKNTNSVIAAHRGYHGAPYFREIEKIDKGDKVIIKNPWGKLYYTVESIAIIPPNDNDSVKIQEGRDMITLMTCHPYRSHGKFRYLVYCVRSGEKMNSNIVEKTERINTTGTKFVSSEYDIRRENLVRIIACVAIAFIILMVIISLIREARDNRKKKRNKHS